MLGVKDEEDVSRREVPETKVERADECMYMDIVGDAVVSVTHCLILLSPKVRFQVSMQCFGFVLVQSSPFALPFFNSSPDIHVVRNCSSLLQLIALIFMSLGTVWTTREYQYSDETAVLPLCPRQYACQCTVLYRSSGYVLRSYSKLSCIP